MWKIKNFPGGREFLLRCKFGLPSVAAEEETQGRLPPIKVKFEVRLPAHPRCCIAQGPAAGVRVELMAAPLLPLCLESPVPSPSAAAADLVLLPASRLPQIPYYSVSGALAGWVGQDWAGWPGQRMQQLARALRAATCVLMGCPCPPPCSRLAGIQIRYLKVIERSGYQALPWCARLLQPALLAVMGSIQPARFILVGLMAQLPGCL